MDFFVRFSISTNMKGRNAPSILLFVFEIDGDYLRKAGKGKKERTLLRFERNLLLALYRYSLALRNI